MELLPVLDNGFQLITIFITNSIFNWGSIPQPPFFLAYKKLLLKLTKANHFNKFFIENKLKLFKTLEEIREIINIPKANKVINRSSHQRCSIKKCFLRKFTNFTGKHLCQSLFLNKVTGLRPATFCVISKNVFFTEYLWTTASR